MKVVQQGRRFAAVQVACVLLSLPLALSAVGQGSSEGVFESGSIVDIPSLRLGSFDLGLAGEISALHDDNVFIASSNPVADRIVRVAPVFFLASGDYSDRLDSFMLVNYLVDARFFSENPELHYTNQDLSLEGQIRNGKEVFRLSQRARYLADTSDEVGDFVKRRLYTTVVEWEYVLTAKTNIYLGAFQAIRDYDTFNDNKEWYGRIGARYEYSPKTRFRLETTLGHLQVSGENSDQRYYSINAAIEHALSPKFSWHARIGGESREQLDFDTTKTAIVGRVGVNYIQDELTTFSLEVLRSISPAISTGSADVTSSAARLALRKRLLQRMTAGITLGYRHSAYDYMSLNSGGDENRVDDQVILETRLEYQISSLWNLYTSFSYRKSVSTEDDRSFRSNQVECGLSLHF